MTLRNKLIQLRDQAGMTQQDLAEALHISRQTITRWESGKCLPSKESLHALASLYGVSTRWLCSDETDFPEVFDFAQNETDDPDQAANELGEESAELPAESHVSDDSANRPQENIADLPTEQHPKMRKKRRTIILTGCIVLLAFLLTALLYWKTHRSIQYDDMPNKTIPEETNAVSFELTW